MFELKINKVTPYIDTSSIIVINNSSQYKWAADAIAAKASYTII